jgi:hypothetical protein
MDSPTVFATRGDGAREQVLADPQNGADAGAERQQRLTGDPVGQGLVLCHEYRRRRRAVVAVLGAERDHATHPEAGEPVSGTQ